MTLKSFLDGNVTSYPVTDLNRGTKYYYRVWPYSSASTGKNSEVTSATTSISSSELVINPAFDSSITTDPRSTSCSIHEVAHTHLTRRCSRRLAGLFPPFSTIKILPEIASRALATAGTPSSHWGGTILLALGGVFFAWLPFLLVSMITGQFPSI